jgi:DNA-binding response OmpR family regulator
MNNLGRILIADDEEAFLRAIVKVLRKEGYDCSCASDSETATKMIRSDSYDLLIADVKIPGNQQLKFIQQLPSIAEGMPVILVTAYPSLASAVMSIQLPVAAYLIKPIDFDELLAQVYTSIERYQTYRSVRSIQQRLQNWNMDMANIGQTLALTSTSSDTYSTAVGLFLDLSFQNITDTLSDMKHLTKALAKYDASLPVCHLFNCPKLTALTDAILETIDVIERTKSAFKSKDLGELRQKLEKLLKSETT